MAEDDLYGPAPRSAYLNLSVIFTKGLRLPRTWFAEVSDTRWASHLLDE